jgi:CTP:molybdopterin cytidylyltransferase MocA
VIGLIPAAGRGSRLGSSGPKELEVLDERTGMRLCDVALDGMRRADIDQVVVVISPAKQALREARGDGRQYDPGEVSLTAVVDAARRAGWPVVTHVFTDGAFRDAGTREGLACARALWAR